MWLTKIRGLVCIVAPHRSPPLAGSVEAKIEKRTPAHLFTQSYSPTTQGRGGLRRTHPPNSCAHLRSPCLLGLPLLLCLHRRSWVEQVWACASLSAPFHMHSAAFARGKCEPDVAKSVVGPARAWPEGEVGRSGPDRRCCMRAHAGATMAQRRPRRPPYLSARSTPAATAAGSLQGNAAPVLISEFRTPR